MSFFLQLCLRFVLGGVAVSLFALVAQALVPKTFAGLFGAAPAVAVVSLAISQRLHGPGFVAIEGRAMALGALALSAYSAVCVATVRRARIPVWLGAGLCWCVWFLVAFALRELALNGGIL